MPLLLWLGTLLGSLLSAIATFFVQYATKRALIVVAVVAAISTLTFAFFAALVALLNTFLGAVPSQVSYAASWFLPSNATACLAAVVTAHALRWAYEWNVKVIQFRL